MVVLGGGVVSYERGTPVGSIIWGLGNDATDLLFGVVLDPP